MAKTHINKLKELYKVLTATKGKEELKAFNNYIKYLCEGYPQWLVESYVNDIKGYRI